MFRWFYRLILGCIIFVLIIFNILTLTSTAFNTLLSGAMASVMGIQSVSSKMHSKLSLQTETNKRLQNTIRKHKAQVSNFGRSFTVRTKRITLRSIAEVPAAAIPFAGVALLVAGTVWEIDQLCDSLKEMETLYREMDLDESIDQATLEFVCHPQLPF